MAIENNSIADVSIIMPAYNAATTIVRAVMSAVNQTLRPKEIIVCDDGSADDTVKIFQNLGAEINGVRLLLTTQPNKGAGAARNRAISASSSEWLAFLDADDEWLPEKLEASFNAIESGTYTLIAHDYLQVSPDGSEIRVECARRFRAQDDPFDGLYRYGFISTSTVVTKREAVLAVGGFDETLETAQDFDLWLKILRPSNASFLIFDSVLLRYAVNPKGITSHTGRRLECTLRVAQRHQPTRASLLFRIIAVHFEAFNAYRHSFRFDKAFWILCVMVVRLASTLISTYLPEHIRLLIIKWSIPFMWAWVGIMFCAYLYRFNQLMVAFYKLVINL